MTDTEHEIMTSDEACEFLRMSKRSFYRLLAEGKLPAFKAGNQWRFRRDVLLAWIKKQEEQNEWYKP